MYKLTIYNKRNKIVDVVPKDTPMIFIDQQAMDLILKGIGDDTKS